MSECLVIFSFYRFDYKKEDLRLNFSLLVFLTSFTIFTSVIKVLHNVIESLPILTQFRFSFF